MVVLYFLIGIISAVIAAIPPGAANIVVVKTAVERSVGKSLKIIYGAGLGEIVLAFLALQGSMQFIDFFEMNLWVQISFTSILFLVGVLFIFENKLNISLGDHKIKGSGSSDVITGFLLSLFNPPVLIYWLLALAVIHKYILMVSAMSPLLTLILFFLGVYVGKTLTLYLYSKFGAKWVKNSESSKSKMYRFIGVFIVLVSVAQGIRLAFIPH